MHCSEGRGRGGSLIPAEQCKSRWSLGFKGWRYQISPNLRLTDAEFDLPLSGQSSYTHRRTDVTLRTEWTTLFSRSTPTNHAVSQWPHKPKIISRISWCFWNAINFQSIGLISHPSTSNMGSIIVSSNVWKFCRKSHTSVVSSDVGWTNLH